MGRRCLPTALLAASGLAAVCCWSQEPTLAPSDEGSPRFLRGEIIPSPEPLVNGAEPMHEHGVIEPCCPAERKIAVNLSVDRPSHVATTQLKTKGGEILAEAVEVPEEHLEFEVLITAPCGEIPVYFAIPDDSTLHSIYYRYKDKDPARILSFMDTIRPPVVRVVALRRERIVPYYAGTRLRTRHSKEPWRVFYEVCLPDSACPEPVLVPVLEEDDYLHDMMYRTVARVPMDQDIVLVKQLSGQLCEHCCTICGQSPGRCGPHCPPEKCYCGGQHTFGYGRNVPVTPPWGANRCSRCCPICNYSPTLCRSRHIAPETCYCGGRASFIQFGSQHRPGGSSCYPLRIVCNKGCLPNECHCLEPDPYIRPQPDPRPTIAPSAPAEPAFPQADQ